MAISWFFSPKIIKLHNADIHIHYANNKGRGKNNVTVSIVPVDTPRPTNTKYSPDILIEQYCVAGWRGKVEISPQIIQKYGGVKS
jgi:hypothetical protein